MISSSSGATPMATAVGAKGFSVRSECDPAEAWARTRERLRGAIGADAFAAFAASLALDRIDGTTVHLTVATRFLRRWVEAHYVGALRTAFAAENVAVERVVVAARSLGGVSPPAARVESEIVIPVQSAAPAPTMARSVSADDPLSPRSRLAALSDRHAGFAMLAEAIETVASAALRSPRDIEAVLTRLMMRHAVVDQPLTVDLTRAVIDETTSGAPRVPRIETIQTVVAARYGVTRRDLQSARRTSGVVRPRQIAMYLAKSMTLKSLPEIGRCFGGRDHTTVLHAVRKIDRLRREDGAVSDQLDSLARAVELES